MPNAAEPRPARRSFEDALLAGAIGFAIGKKPLRFEKLPDHVAMSFAEIGAENCYHVFETEAEARRRVAGIPDADRLGCRLVVRAVRYLPQPGPHDGPMLDATGHPFAMRALIVDRAGEESEWQHRGRFGWCEPVDGEVSPAPRLTLRRWLGQWLRPQ